MKTYFLGVIASLFIALLVVSGCQRMATEDWMTEGDKALSEGRTQEAEKDYLHAVRVNPGDSRAHLALGGVYASEHNLALAEEEFMTAVELNPHDSAAHAQLARIYFDQSRWFLAEQQYRAAVALDQSRANYRIGLGQTLSKENHPAQAEQELVTAAGLDPTNADAHYQLAELLRATPGHEIDAQYEYDQAHALDTKYVDPKSAPPATSDPEESAESAASASDASASADDDSAPGGKLQLKPVNKRFLLTKTAKVYEQPDPNSDIVATVHQRRYIQVTAIGGDWLQVRLRDGSVGFVPAVAAE
ncbi:MAG TPA: tetratricopeptide repeat protein [Candidatus Binataceae bacterium]|nr:tetratricopeptide repeat protein [Candidatus Binataceae bacterium]